MVSIRSGISLISLFGNPINAISRLLVMVLLLIAKKYAIALGAIWAENDIFFRFSQKKY
jgi:hypothetical protein